MALYPERVGRSVKNSQTVVVFLSSPSDCLRHRKLSRQILGEIEDQLGELYKISIKIVDDSTFVPGYGQPQSVIDKQTPNFHMYLGFMWQRYGTVIPGTNQSGTAKEYASAVTRYQETGSPNILFYFDITPPETLDAIDLEQLGLVNRFKKQIEARSFFKSFKTETELESLLRHDLSLAVRRYAEDKIGKNTIVRPSVSLGPKAEGNLRVSFYHAQPLPVDTIRREELMRTGIDAFHAAFSNPSSLSILSIVGSGGMGKTTFARQLIDEIENIYTDSINGIFWYSFYESKSESSEEFFYGLYMFLFQNMPAPDAPAHRLKFLIWEALKTGKFIVVMDGLEYFQTYAPENIEHGALSDRMLLDFIKGVGDIEEAFVIITTRIGPIDFIRFGREKRILVEGFGEREIAAYLWDDEPAKQRSDLRSLADDYSGHPLSLRLIKGLAEQGKLTPQVLRSAKEKKSAPIAERLDLIFSISWDSLNEVSRFILGRLSTLRVGAFSEEISAIKSAALAHFGKSEKELNFCDSLEILKESPLIDTSMRDEREFYTAPALLRRFAYDRLSSRDRRKAHLDWIEYAEGHPSASLGKFDDLEPILELIHQLIGADDLGRAWEMYSRRGKFGLSRFLMDRGKHAIAIDMLGEFWNRRMRFVMQAANYPDFENELIGFYAMHLFLVGMLEKSRQVLNQASNVQFGVPVCLRVRANVLLGDFEMAREQLDRALKLDHSPYSTHWAKALLLFYRDRDNGCLVEFERATQMSFMVSRSFAGFIRFDHINALLYFSKIGRARRELQFLEDQLVDQEGVLSLVPYLRYAKALIHATTLTDHEFMQQLSESLTEAKKFGDWFVEFLTSIELLSVYNRADQRKGVLVIDQLAARLIDILHDITRGKGNYGMPIHEEKACQALLEFAVRSKQGDLIAEMKQRLEKLQEL